MSSVSPVGYSKIQLVSLIPMVGVTHVGQDKNAYGIGAFILEGKSNG